MRGHEIHNYLSFGCLFVFNVVTDRKEEGGQMINNYDFHVLL